MKTQSIKMQSSEKERYDSIVYPILQFYPLQFQSNKLIDKGIPALEIDNILNIVKCKQNGLEISIIRAAHSLQTANNVIGFFQVEIVKCNNLHANQSGVNIGLVTKDANPRQHAGKQPNSVGYIDGQIYVNKKKVATTSSLQKKDRIGCGINCSNMSFFFTKNKQIMYRDIMISQYSSKWNQFYPAVALQNQDEAIKVYFDKDKFVFNVQKFSEQIQKQIKKQISECTQQYSENQQIISTSQIYSLISQYMLFNGYKKTLQLMKLKKSQIGFQPINKLTKSFNGTKLINLDEDQEIRQQENQLLNLQAISENDEDEKEKEIKNLELPQSKFQSKNEITYYE